MRDNWFKKLIVRGEKETDYDEIYRINTAAYERNSEAELINTIRSTKSYEFGFSLVAVKEDIIMGHAFLSRGLITHRNKKQKCLILISCAVPKENQKQGIGTALILEAIERAQEVGFNTIISICEPNFIGKFGFAVPNNYKLKTSFNAPEERVLIKELVNNPIKFHTVNVLFPIEYLTYYKLIHSKPDSVSEKTDLI
jgi:predicted N-acetyltransferase YhbS